MEERKQLDPEHTLVINYAGLQPGGIETYFVELMRYSVRRGYRVVWLTTRRCVEATPFRDVVDHQKIEKVYAKSGWHWLKPAEVRFSLGEKVTMLSCEPISFMKAEGIREKAKTTVFSHYLVLPHFTGNAYYPERYFSGKIVGRFWYCWMQKMAERWSKRNCIRAFSYKHIEAYEKNYCIEITDKSAKVIGGMKRIEPFDEARIARRAAERTDEFVIVTCSRFDFPHKGYILGLIDSYASLKKTYPQLKLTIVGYGDGEKRIREKLERLPKEIAADIELAGMLPLEQVKQQFKSGHLNVGLAGALLDGASCGLPSLLVRHYTEACETYGFINRIEGTLLKEDPGEEIAPYIEQVIMASEQEYVSMCAADFQEVARRRNYDPEYFFGQSNAASESTMKKIDIYMGKTLNLLCFIKQRFFGISGYEN